MGLFEIAPTVAIPIYPLITEHSDKELSLYSKSGATGTLLPNGEMLTATHVFKLEIVPSSGQEWTVAYPFLIESKLEFAGVLAFEPRQTFNGDWILLTFEYSKAPLFSPAPDSLFARYIRFDGSLPIPKDTPLYCIGYPRTPGGYPGLVGLPRELTIVKGRAFRDYAPGEEVTAISDTKIDMRGMSGGPVGIYDYHTGTFTVVGTVTTGSIGLQLFGISFFTFSRIAPDVMQRLGPPAPHSELAVPMNELASPQHAPE